MVEPSGEDGCLPARLVRVQNVLPPLLRGGPDPGHRTDAPRLNVQSGMRFTWRTQDLDGPMVVTLVVEGATYQSQHRARLRLRVDSVHADGARRRHGRHGIAVPATLTASSWTGSSTTTSSPAPPSTSHNTASVSAPPTTDPDPAIATASTCIPSVATFKPTSA